MYRIAAKRARGCPLWVDAVEKVCDERGEAFIEAFDGEFLASIAGTLVQCRQL